MTVIHHRKRQDMFSLRKAMLMALATRNYENKNQFAEASGFHKMTLSYWYRELREPSLTNLKKLAEAFDMKLSEFIALGESEK